MSTKVAKRVNAVMSAFGMPEPDYDVVHEIYYGVVEPGYGYDDDTVLVVGNWNEKRSGTPWEKFHPVRLENALETTGAEIDWYDEWTRCEECYRAVRTQPNSYSWTPSYIWTEYGPVCVECVLGNLESYLDLFINNPENAFPFDVSLRDYGFEQWEPRNPHTYETGWHPHQDDDPKKILPEIQDDFPDDDIEVVFLIDGVGQFDMRWSAWFRKEGSE